MSGLSHRRDEKSQRDGRVAGALPRRIGAMWAGFRAARGRHRRAFWASITAVLAVVVPSALVSPSVVAEDPAPTIVADQADYLPGATVTLTGADWYAGEAVTVYVNDDVGNTWSHTASVVADANGAFTYAFDLPSWFVASYLVVAVGSSGRQASTTFTDLAIGTYDQCANDDGDGYGGDPGTCDWIDGNLQRNNSTYFEGDSTVQRVWLTQFQPGTTHSVTFTYGTTKGAAHAYDFLTSWDYSEDWVTEADRCDGIAGCTAADASENEWAIPDDPVLVAEWPEIQASVSQDDRQMTARGAQVTNVTEPKLVKGVYGSGDSETEITVSFLMPTVQAGDPLPPMCYATKDGPLCDVAIWFGAHVAVTNLWVTEGDGLPGAGQIQGSPYHVQLSKIDGASVGNRDNQMQANAIVTPAKKRGTKFNDLDADGVFDAGEPGIAGVTIYVDYNDDGELTAGEPFAVTGADGTYEITGIAEGTWKVREVQPADTTCSLPTTTDGFGCYYQETFTNEAVYEDNDFGNYYDVDLSISKDASTSLTRTYTWAITKESDATYRKFAGDPATTHPYSVSVDRTVTDSDWAASGTITIQNTTTRAAGITGVSDEISGGITAAVSCGVTFPYMLAAGATLSCTYSAALPDATARTNTATVTTDGTNGVNGGTGNADVSFANATVTTVGYETVNVTDSNAGALGQTSDDQTFSYDDTFACPTDITEYSGGVHSYSRDNTATITETGQTASATVDVYCYLPVVTKTAATGYTRTYDWTIDKEYDGDYTMFAGDSVDHDYLVTVDRTTVDDQFTVAGTITVANPNPDAPMTIDVSDSVGGVTATITSCTGDADLSDGLTIEGGGSSDCGYTATVPMMTDGTNTATATLNGIDVTGTADYAFGDPTSVVGFASVDVTDSNGESWSATGDASWTYSETFTCPSDTSLYDEDGYYTTTSTNTASIDQIADASDTADVTLHCYLPSISKTAAGTYDERHEWTVEKTVDPLSQSAFAGDTVAFDWTITVGEEVVEENFDVSGSVTVSNPNPEDDLVVPLTDLLSDDTVVTFVPDDDCDLVDGTLTVPAGGTAMCDYVANDLPYTDDAAAPGLNSAKIVLNGIELPASDTIEWTANVIRGSATLDDQQHPYDDELVDGGWSVTYSDSYTCSTESTDYTGGKDLGNEVSNTATVWSGGSLQDTSTATTTIDCYVPSISKIAAGSYGERHEWTVDKSVTPTSQSAFAGDTVNFTWTIDVVETVFEEGFDVSGTITVSNPNPEDTLVVPLVDLIGGTTPGLIDQTTCAFDGTDLTVQPSDEEICSYSATLADLDDVDQAPTLNTATITLNGVDYRAEDTIEWTPDVIRGTAVIDDDRWPFDDYAVDGGDQIGYGDSFQCPSDTSLYDTDGKYTGTVTNVVEIYSDGVFQDDGQATTTIGCFIPAISKTAAGTYDETHTWDVEKTVTTGESGFPGDVLDWTWTVKASESATESNFDVAGTVTVVNPNAEDALVVPLTDVLSDGTPVSFVLPDPDDDCDLADGTLTVPAGGTATCEYVADDLAYDDVGLAPNGNRATITLNEITFDADATIGWTANVIDGTATIDDAQEPDLPLTLTAGEGPWTWTETQTLTCSTDTTAYGESGSYTDTRDNTATVTGSDGQTDSSSASVTSTCYLWDVSKTADGTYDEEYGWDITKTVDPASQSGNPGDTLEWTWTVSWNSVFERELDHAVSGVITVTNPADIDLTVDVTDVLTGDVAATVVCDDTDGGTDLTIVAGGSGTCGYTASPGSRVAQNTATATRNGVSVSDTVDVDWVLDEQLGLDASISDSNHVTIPVDGTNPFTYTDSHQCSADRSDYGDDATYTGSADNTATITWTGGSDSDAASTSYTCDATLVNIVKTVNGSVDPSKDIRFRLYEGDQSSATDLGDEVSTAGVQDGVLEFQTALVPGTTYTICEAPVPAGFTFEISVDGGIVSTFAGPPGASNPTGEIQCFSFVAAAAPSTMSFDINNSYPGGAPRTPGYWKNWSTCSGGQQAATAEKLGGTAEGVYLLDDLLPQTVGMLLVDTCDKGVLVLDSRYAVDETKFKAGTQASNDAAYELARNYLAVILNHDAGACVVEGLTWDTRAGSGQTFDQVVAEAQRFLVEIKYDGAGEVLTPRLAKKGTAAANRTYALYLAGILDDYNNGELCTGEPSH